MNIQKRIIKHKNLLDRNRKGQRGGDFRRLDEFLSDTAPALADSGAGDHIFPGRPGGVRRLNSDKHLSEQLLRHLSPTALLQPINPLVLNHTIPPTPHFPSQFSDPRTQLLSHKQENHSFLQRLSL